MFIDFAQPISLPPYWLNHPQVVKSYEQMQDEAEDAPVAEMLGVPHACPLLIRGENEEEWWKLPIEPVITINGKNTIIKRQVLKVAGTKGERRGTVKELWTQDDYEVNISGIFISDRETKLPERDIRKLRAYCEARAVLEVQSELFTLFNIKRIAIEDFSFPFTKGMENQMFTIKGSSDNYDEKQLFV